MENGAAGHIVHAGGYHIEVIAHADEVRVRPVTPEQRVGKGAVAVVRMPYGNLCGCCGGEAKRQGQECFAVVEILFHEDDILYGCFCVLLFVNCVAKEWCKRVTLLQIHFFYVLDGCKYTDFWGGMWRRTSPKLVLFTSLNAVVGENIVQLKLTTVKKENKACHFGISGCSLRCFCLG